MVKTVSEESARVKFEFTENSDKSVICKHCEKTLKSSSTFNLKRHIILNHRTVADQLQIYSESADEPPNKKCKKVSVKIDPQIFIKACVKLTTKHSFPLSLMDCDGFKEIVTPLEEALNVSINRTNIKDKISQTYSCFKEEIINEIKNKLINVKIDSTSLQSRSILGINIQFIENDQIIIRTLSMKEMKVRQTGLNLKNVLLEELSKFAITENHIYNITIDNGANMVLAVELIKEDSTPVYFEATDDSNEFEIENPQIDESGVNEDENVHRDTDDLIISDSGVEGVEEAVPFVILGNIFF